MVKDVGIIHVEIGGGVVLEEEEGRIGDREEGKGIGERGVVKEGLGVVREEGGEGEKEREEGVGTTHDGTASVQRELSLTEGEKDGEEGVDPMWYIVVFLQL